MKNIKFLMIVAVLISGIFFGSCDEDQFSQIKVIELPDHDPLIAATAKLNTDLTIPFVFVSHSKELLDNTNYDVIDDASVKLYKNDELFLEFLWDNTFSNYKAADTPTIEEGNYRMEISADGYEPIVATQTLPKNCEILGVEIKEDAFVTEWGESQDIIEVKVRDDEGEKNYYSIEVWAQGTLPNGDPLTTEVYGYTEDPIMEYGYDEDFLPDDTFSGGTYIMRYVASKSWVGNFQGGEIEKLIVRVNSHSEDYFRYSVSRVTYEDSQDIPFIEPVLITTNWDNGLGVFGLTNTAKFELDY